MARIRRGCGGGDEEEKVLMFGITADFIDRIRCGC